jgi:hypothetical protein
LGQALIHRHHKSTVHNGRKASFWCSSWIDEHAPTMLCSLLFGHGRRKNRSIRNSILGGCWIGDIAYDLTPELLGEYFKLWRAIQAVQLDLDDTREDCIV